MNGWLVGRSVGVFVCLFGWLVELLVGWLVDWFNNLGPIGPIWWLAWLVGGLLACLLACLLGWLLGCFRWVRGRFA